MPEIDETLARYLAARDTERDDHVNRALDALSDRERALVREAAVMGYVQGNIAGKVNDYVIPKNSAIVWQVIASCQSADDLYPTISGLTAMPERDADA